MAMKFWYAPQLRPPGFGGMPWKHPDAILERERMFQGQRYAAWAYSKELPADIVEHFDLKLVLAEAA